MTIKRPDVTVQLQLFQFPNLKLDVGPKYQIHNVVSRFPDSKTPLISLSFIHYNKSSKSRCDRSYICAIYYRQYYVETTPVQKIELIHYCFSPIRHTRTYLSAYTLTFRIMRIHSSPVQCSSTLKERFHTSRHIAWCCQTAHDFSLTFQCVPHRDASNFHCCCIGMGILATMHGDANWHPIFFFQNAEFENL
jgi:hypothetical protein